MKTGILLVNLGSPISPSLKDVKRYLTQFLTDPRVIDLPFFQRHLLVRGCIVPKRSKASAKLYQSIWTKEGSPLISYGKEVAKLVQTTLGPSYQVELAMRYQNPSIENQLKKLKGVDQLIIFPLFPQYASATTGSICEKVFDSLKSWPVVPSLRIITTYCDHPAFINAHLARALEYPIASYDHILFSYHGLPEKQVKKTDETGTCLSRKNCCEKHRYCYAAQCLKTTREITSSLSLPDGKWSLVFQSRLGRGAWLKPYAETTLKSLANNGKKKILVFSPSFVSDCLETLEEIGMQYKAIFLKEGGAILDLVESLNTHPKWIEAIATIIKNS